MQGVILDYATLAPADLDTVALERSLPYWHIHLHTGPDEIAGRLAEADVVLTNKVPIGAAELRAAPRLRLIGVMATGTDHIDLEAARAHGVMVCNAVGYSTSAVVQHTFALMLALATRLVDYRAAVVRGDWTRSGQFCLLDHPIEELAGRRLGLVGYGAIGRGVAALATAIGMEVKVAESFTGAGNDVRRYPLDELLPQVDVLSLHCPLTAATRNLMSAERLARLPRGAWLINTARGGLVDEVALVAALRSGQLGGAGLDVLREEPPAASHPLLAPLPNLVVTPHNAWGARQSRQRLVDQMVQVIEGWRRGNPPNRVV